MIPTIYDSPIGRLQLLVDQEALISRWFKNKGKVEENLPDNVYFISWSRPEFKPYINWLESYFRGQTNPAIIFSSQSNEPDCFWQNVWRILKKISYGKTMTYKEIAKTIEAETKQKVSAQAVGGAVGANPILLLIFCHRVISATNALTAYSAGTDRKIWLLNHEKV
ncbi:methylated-DNA--[protein]-cysteine S-methyltransferase [Facklamia sp. P9177]|uniref:methylated-DNA--[protein]-cysteine S-methyltransferase n=1 Tax=Facklamia sp. P9177 TaxID=3421945 RepID=UPI003D17132A